MMIKRLKLPNRLSYPVQIVTVHFAADQTVEKGDALYTLRDAKGKSGVMRAPFAGKITEGPVPEGAHFETARPVLGLIPQKDPPPQRQMKREAKAPTGQTKPAENTASTATIRPRTEKTEFQASQNDSSNTSDEKLGLARGGLILLATFLILVAVSMAFRMTFEITKIVQVILGFVLAFSGIALAEKLATRRVRTPEVGFSLAILPVVAIGGLGTIAMPDAALDDIQALLPQVSWQMPDFANLWPRSEPPGPEETYGIELPDLRALSNGPTPNPTQAQTDAFMDFING